MMRVMRKILKRKVSIVMAVLVILGIAVYGVSAFAEEQTATAETFTVNPNYIYLNPAGMNLGSVDWTSSSADIRLNVTGWKDIHQGTYDPKSGYWYWDATNWEIKDVNTYFFTYGTDWSVIKSKSYYRTEVSSDILATGKVYAQNGTASQQIDSQNVYALKEYTSNAGRSLAFVNMTAGELSGVQAQFSLDSNYDDFTSDQLTALQLSDGKVTVPNDVNGKAYQYVRFIDAQNNAITDSFDISTAISKGGILYYGIRQDSSKTYSEWSQEKKSETTPNVTKLYFNNLSFWTSDDITIQIGSGEPVKVVPDDTATNTLSYNISGTIDKDTIISITKNGVTYRFYPNGTDNLITYSGSNICIKGTYQASSPNTVYFDATLSKLSYAGDVADNSLPLKDAGISYHAWNTETDFTDGDLTKPTDNKAGGLWTIEFTEAGKTKLKANNISSIEVTFKTKLNENAKIGKDGNLNDAQLDYSNAIYPTVDPTNPNNSKTPGEDHIKDQAIVYSFSIDVTKVDGNNNATKLSGVQFDLYRYTGNETNPTEEQLKQNAVAIKTNLTTGIDGKIAESGLNGLKNGRYFLVETKAASGYNLLKAPVEVNLNVDYVVKKTTDKWYDESNNLIGTKTTVTSTKFTGGDTNNAGTYSVTIENRKGFTLPKTGDIGTAMFLIIGIGGMLAAVYIMLRGRKRA